MAGKWLKLLGLATVGEEHLVSIICRIVLRHSRLKSNGNKYAFIDVPFDYGAAVILWLC